MGAGQDKPKAPPESGAPSAPPAEAAAKVPEKAPEPTPAKAPEPTPAKAPVAKADPTPAPTPTPAKASEPTPAPAPTPTTTAAEAAASIAAPGKEEEPKAKPKAKGESKAKGKAKPKAKSEKPEGEKKEERPSFQCCVRNLGEDATDEQLKTLFEPFGTVGTITMIRKPDGKCRGLAFISLGSAEEVSKAIAEMDKKTIDGKEISVAQADGKKEKGDSKGAKGKSKGKEKGGATEKGKGKGKGKKGEDRQPSQQVGYIPPNPYGQQPMYGYQYPYAYGQYGSYAAQAAQYQAAQLAQMQFMAQSMYAAQLAPSDGFSPQTEYEGTLKSLSTRNGYGFIEWPANETYKWYIHAEEKSKQKGKPRDVHISADLLPANCKNVGAKLKFRVTFNSKGHPQASTCVAA